MKRLSGLAPVLPLLGLLILGFQAPVAMASESLPAPDSCSVVGTGGQREWRLRFCPHRPASRADLALALAAGGQETARLSALEAHEEATQRGWLPPCSAALDECARSSATRGQVIQAIAASLASSGVGAESDLRSGETAFIDLAVGSPAAQVADSLYRGGVLVGCAPGPRFCPDLPARRGEMVLMVGAAAGIADRSGPNFADVAVTDRAYPYLQGLWQRGGIEPCGSPGRWLASRNLPFWPTVTAVGLGTLAALTVLFLTLSWQGLSALRRRYRLTLAMARPDVALSWQSLSTWRLAPSPRIPAVPLWLGLLGASPMVDHIEVGAVSAGDVALLGILALYALAVWRRKRGAFRAAQIGFVAIAALYIAAYLLGGGDERRLVTLLALVALGAVVVYLGEIRTNVKAIWTGLLLAALVLSAAAVGQFAVYTLLDVPLGSVRGTPWGYGGLHLGRAASFYFDPNFLALLLLPVLGACLYLRVHEPPAGPGRWLAQGAAAVIGLGLLTTLSRSALLVVTLGLLWLLLTSQKKLRERLGRAVMTGLVLAGFGLSALLLVASPASTGERLQILTEASRVLAANLWTGGGPGTLIPVQLDRGSDVLEVHNTYLQLALDAGVITLVVLLALIGLALWRSLSTREPLRRALGFGLILYLLQAGLLSALFMKQLWLLLGLAVADWTSPLAGRDGRTDR